MCARCVCACVHVCEVCVCMCAHEVYVGMCEMYMCEYTRLRLPTCNRSSM